MTAGKPLSGRRLLIAEDEFLPAMGIAHALEQLGATIDGPVATLSEARHAAAARPDGVILDIQLGAERAEGLAQELHLAGIPVILTTGYDISQLSEPLRAFPRLTKPVSDAELERVAIGTFTGKDD